MSNVVRVKLNRTDMFSLGGDTPMLAAPHSTKRVSLLETHGSSVEALTSKFDLDHIHVVTLPDIEPHLPRRRPEMDDALYSAICQAAYSECVARRADADSLRQRIKHFVANGLLTIIEDESNFLDEEPVSTAELTAAGKAKK